MSRPIPRDPADVVSNVRATLFVHPYNVSIVLRTKPSYVLILKGYGYQLSVFQRKDAISVASAPIPSNASASDLQAILELGQVSDSQTFPSIPGAFNGLPPPGVGGLFEDDLPQAATRGHLPPEGHRSDTARATTTSVASTPARSGPSHQTQSPLPPSSPPNLGSEGLLVNPFIEQVCTTISSYSSFASHCINQSIFPIDLQLLSQSSIQPVSSQIDSPAVSFVYLSIVRMLKPMPRTSQVQFTLIILCHLQPLQVPTITLIE